jgi:hypothetical protein
MFTKIKYEVFSGMNTFKPIIPEDGEEKDNNAVDNEPEELRFEKISTFPVSIRQ